MLRKDPLVTGEMYHVMNKSIAGYRIYTREADYLRMLHLIRFFSLKEEPAKFSYFLEHDAYITTDGIEARIAELARDGQRVQIIAYCIMPTHFHLVVKQLEDNGVSEFLRKSLNAYARYFNVRYKRKGTLWMSRFKNVLVENHEQLLHLTRYLHLNPVSAGLVRKADNWLYSSYREYVERKSAEWPMTKFDEFIDMTGAKYRKFTKDQADYQRALAKIKKQVLE